MPTLSIRGLGVSYLLEPGPSHGLDLDALHVALSAAYGPAVAVLTTEPPAPADEAPGRALLVDRKADAWPGLLDRVAGLVRGQGYGYAVWSEDHLARPPRATLHFHE
jgi:hypothetical protein